MVSAACLDILDLGCHSSLEEGLLDARHLPIHGVADVLVDLRHAREEGRPDHREVCQQELGALRREVHRRSFEQQGDGVLALEDVGQGQVAQVDVQREQVDARIHIHHADGRDDVDVRQHHALGRAGGAAGVHDGDHIVLFRRRVGQDLVTLQRLIEADDGNALGLDGSLGRGVDLPDADDDLQVLARVAGVNFVHEEVRNLLEALVLDDQDLGARVPDDVARGVRAQGVVDRDRRPVEGGTGEVREHPLDTIAGPD
mmetsp:Transcript_90299/g.258394  ORF Transcript_90299/g.258394 Transcript_90299/m.258394 type:complete len:257 (+) Transcript_90299:1099-1869(+)